MIITACEFNQGLDVRLQDGKHHMTQPDSLLNMGRTKSVTLFSALMFYVVKRSNISAHNAFIRVESRAACHRKREREGGGFTLLTFPALSPPVCDALLLLLKEGWCKVHHGNRGIWWQEAFYEVARADITHPIMQSSQQLPPWNKTLFGDLTRTETSHTHSCVESVSWTLKLIRYCNLKIPGHRKKTTAGLSSFLKTRLYAVTVSAIFSRSSEMSVTADVGQDAWFGCLLPATAPPR